MGLISDITNIATGLYPDSTFKLLSKFETEIESFYAEETELPYIILNNKLSKTGEIKQNNNVIKDTRIVILILKLDSEYNTDAQSEQLRADCEAVADRLAVNIYQELEVRPSGNQRYKVDPEFNLFASNLTGVSLDMNINYNEIVNFNKPE